MDAESGSRKVPDEEQVQVPEEVILTVVTQDDSIAFDTSYEATTKEGNTLNFKLVKSQGGGSNRQSRRKRRRSRKGRSRRWRK